MQLDGARVLSLAEGFAPANRDIWRAVAEKSLKGATVQSLSRTIESVTIDALYAAEGSGKAAPLLVRTRVDDLRAWDVRAPVKAHDEVLEALAGGAASVLLRVRRSDAEDLDGLLDGVLIDVAPIALDAGSDGLVAAGALSRAAKASPAAPLAFHLDPFGEDIGKAETDTWASVAAELAATHPRASLYLADGARIHDAGGEPAWELAFAVATGLAHAKALTLAGLATADAFARIVLALAVDNKPLIGIAKLRAARLMWARITSASGAPTPAVIETRSSFRMLTTADPWSNLVRLTQAGFAGAVGGADAIVLYPHDRASVETDPLGSRYARNAGLILMEEAHLGVVDDPTGGAWAFEALTADLARDAWVIFNRIEGAGGAAEALRSGLIADAVAASVEGLGSSVAEKKTRIVGVTDFRADAAPEAEVAPPSQTLAPIRLEALAQ